MFEFFTTTGFRRYIKQAKAILDRNWTGAYTKPSPGLYPHQWNWDSAFIAIGYSHYRQERGRRELANLLSHQWENGMVPSIVFNQEALGHYFPEPDFWQVPGGRPTSGITMPPLHAVAALALHRRAGDGEDSKAFLAALWPKLLASHRYFYEHRDPEGVGLAYIRHPWESGLDNSPSWDGPLMAIAIDKDRLPEYQRRDLDHGVPASQRPSDDYYDRYVYLVDLFRRLGYDEAAIYRECPFLVQDVLLNSILCRADRDLVEIGRVIGRDTGQVEEWLAATAGAIRERMWSPERGQFDPFCLISHEPLATATAASFMPLFAGAASPDQAEACYQRIDSASFCALHQGNCFTIPNFDMSHQDFDPKNYWRGPVWININWMLSQGLKAYGFQEKCDSMKRDMIQLPVRFGFQEYFDSLSGQGYGSDDFSWTAALFIDLVEEYYDRDQDLLSFLKPWQGRRLDEVRVLNQGGAGKGGHRPGLAQELMTAIGDLKAAFYDLGRGRVDYRAMRDSPEYARYRDLAARLEEFDLASLVTHQEKLAFWVNLYNTLVVHGIVELGIEHSVREVKNFFTHIAYRIGGEVFTPDAIEHGVLRSNARPPYRLFSVFRGEDTRRIYQLDRLDNRVHFALVCGSRSCAPIRYYRAQDIDQQLDAAAESFINSTEVVILPEEGRVLLSQIFNWYQRDFGGRDQVFDFVLEYLADRDKAAYLADHRDRIEVEYLFYDWNLNH